MSAPYIPYRLDGKVALVTGSGRGIGAAIAVELGRCGAKVVVNYANSRESAEKVVAEIKSLGSDAVAFQADVRQVSQTTKLMDNAIAHFGALDIVCSNSGVVSFGHLGDVTEVGSLSFSPSHPQTAYWKTRATAAQIYLTSNHPPTGRIRPRLQPQHARAILRRARGVPAPLRGRAHHPHVVQHGQGLQRAQPLGVLGLQGRHRLVCARPVQGLRRQEDHRQCCRTGRYRYGYVPRCVAPLHPGRGEVYC